MPNSRFGYSVKENSFKGLNIDCIRYSNIIRITYYSYSYSGTILNPNIIRIRIPPNICARILFVFVFAHSQKTNIIRIRIRSKFWFRIIFILVFGPKNSIRSPLFLARTYEYPFGSSYQDHLYPQPLLDIFFWIYTSASWWSDIDHPSICISTLPRSYLHANTHIHRIDVDEMFKSPCIVVT